MAQSFLPPSKTLRQYRKEQKKAHSRERGTDFEDFLILSGEEQALPEQALWRAVILQMMTDALSNSQKTDQKRFKRDAKHWLTRHSRDFKLVCDYAGYDPDWLQEQINRFLKLHASQQPQVSTFPKPTYEAPMQSFSISYKTVTNANTISIAEHA